MLKFVQKEDFKDPTGAYSQIKIMDAFRFLCNKVNVFDEITQTYDLNKSEIL